MPKETWLAAVAQYEQRTKDATTARRREDAQSLRDEQRQKDAEEIHRRNKAAAIISLEQFMQGDEGVAAKKLLAASGNIIRFAEDGDSQMNTVYFMDGNGLQTSYEVAQSQSNLFRYSGDEKPPKPQISRCSAEQIVNAAVTHSKWLPHDFMQILRAALDKIANSAP